MDEKQGAQSRASLGLCSFLPTQSAAGLGGLVVGLVDDV